MDLPITRVLRPGSLDEALRLLADDPGARPLAGGTDLVVQIRDGRRRLETLVDLGALALAGVRPHPEGLEIGACTPMTSIATDASVRAVCPSLADAAALVGAWPIQCRATLGGNLANASPAADTVPPLLVAGARALVASASGRRELPLAGMFLAPGKTALAASELITAVIVPAPRAARGATVVERFVKVGPRREQIIAVVSLAARVRSEDGVITEARVALGSVAATPVRAVSVERRLLGCRLDAALRREACEALQDDISPIDDVRAPAWYRRMVAAVLLDRVLAEVAHG
jgi:CO/xanthine dehydrogenase FAD-binding subunit